MTIKEFIEQLKEIPNQDAEILFFEDVSEDPEQCYTLQFKDYKIDDNMDGWLVYINLQGY